MAEINRIDYELIVSATKGNMADIGKILKSYLSSGTMAA